MEENSVETAGKVEEVEVETVEVEKMKEVAVGEKVGGVESG